MLGRPYLGVSFLIKTVCDECCVVVFGWKVCPKVVKSEEKSDKVKKKDKPPARFLIPGI